MWKGSMTELVWQMGWWLRSKQAGSGTDDSGTGGVTGVVCRFRRPDFAHVRIGAGDAS